MLVDDGISEPFEARVTYTVEVNEHDQSWIKKYIFGYEDVVVTLEGKPVGEILQRSLMNMLKIPFFGNFESTKDPFENRDQDRRDPDDPFNPYK